MTQLYNLRSLSNNKQLTKCCVAVESTPNKSLLFAVYVPKYDDLRFGYKLNRITYNTKSNQIESSL